MKKIDWIAILFVYILTGFAVFFYCWGSDNGGLALDAGTALGVAVLWPLFVIKYLLIGAWAFFGFLFDAGSILLGV